MIIKAVSRSGGHGLAAYLMQEHKADRDKAGLIELRGFATDDLRTALVSAELEAENTRCAKPLYHVSFRPDKGEHLTPEQWQECINRLEHRLGLDDQARAVVIHEHQGEQHLHVVWSRIDREQNKARELIFDHERCTEIARQIEKEYGLRQLAPSHERNQEPLTRAEYEEARRQGRPVDEVRDSKATIREAWERSNNGASLDNALRDAGLILANGDTARAPYVVVDQAGKVHGLARTVGEKTKDVQARLGDLDRDLLPTAAQAREYQQERAQEREREARARAACEREAAQAAPRALDQEAEKAETFTPTRDSSPPAPEQPEQQPPRILTPEERAERAATFAKEREIKAEATKPHADGQEYPAPQLTPAKEAAKVKPNPPDREKAPAPNIGRAAVAFGGGVLNLADSLLGGLAGPVTHEQIRQQAAGTQQRTAEHVRDAAAQLKAPLTPQEREAKAREFDRAAAEATRARQAYKDAQANAKGEERRAAMRAEFRAEHAAKMAAREAARLRETEQQRQTREAQEREDREAERRRRERQRER